MVEERKGNLREQILRFQKYQKKKSVEGELEAWEREELY